MDEAQISFDQFHWERFSLTRKKKKKEFSTETSSRNESD